MEPSSSSSTKTVSQRQAPAENSAPKSIDPTPSANDIKQLNITTPQPQPHHVNMQDKQGKTLLIYNCAKGLINTVEELALDPNIDVNLSDNEGNTALIHAAQAGHTQIVQVLVQKYPNLALDKVNNLGQTALIKAAIQGRVNCAKLLLKAGADPYHRDPSRQLCALEWAEYVGRTECAHMIAHFMLAQRNEHNKSANEGKLSLGNGSARMNAARTNSNTFKQLACLVAIPLIGGAHDLPAIVRPRVRSAPPIPTLKITRPSSPASSNAAPGKQLGSGMNKGHRRVSSIAAHGAHHILYQYQFQNCLNRCHPQPQSVAEIEKFFEQVKE